MATTKLLSGKTLNVGSSMSSVSTTTTNMTDGNISSSFNMTGVTSMMAYYKFDSPKDIVGYMIKAPLNTSALILFYDATGKQIHAVGGNVMVSDGSEIIFPAVNSVSSVAIMNASYAFNYVVSEFNVLEDLIVKVGDQLTTPDPGWKRYDDTHPAIKYEGVWSRSSSVSAFSGSHSEGPSNATGLNNKIKFSFTGSKFRFITFGQTNRNSAVNIRIDGVTETFSERATIAIWQMLAYEKIGLSEGAHIVEIWSDAISTTDIFSFDAIDIDSTGTLLHPDEVTDIKELSVGKRIRCHYQATANTVGAFSGLGEETSDFIPPASSATPNGDFYYIMVEDWNGKKRLVADRNIQHSISWDVLNTSGIASGSGKKFALDPIGVLTSSESDRVKITDNGYASGSYGDYFGWKVFDGKNGNGDKWTRDNAISPSELTIYFKKEKVIISGFTITPPPSISAGATSHPKRFKLQGSDDSTTWNDIFEEVNGIRGIEKTFSFNSNNSYSYYKFIVLETEGGAQVQIGEIKFQQSIIGSSATTRLLTGGTASTDKDNEWDKYIVNSPLGNGNDIWNWGGTWGWTSTASGTNANRTVRGNGVVGQYNNYVSTSTTLVTGFRPVLEIESLFTPIKKSFLSVSDGYKKWIKGSPEILSEYGDLIPVLTSDIGSNGKAFSSTQYSSFYTWKAFDKVDSNQWVTNSNLPYPQWIGYEFSEEKLVYGYSIKVGGDTFAKAYPPKDWILQGSNDGGSTWIDLDSRINQTGWTGYEKRVYMITNPNIKYKTYKLNILSNNGQNAVGFSELELLGLIAPYSPATPPSWQTVSPTLPTITQFQEEGMDEFSALDRKVQTVMESPIAMTSEVLGKGKVLKATVNLNKYFDLRKLEVK